uniref:Uncharacterized protein n=1 Tax=Spongospora subterranea TaxID=70186 RepID=A0A0H5R3H8_9EUKA|eukprot:CRZ08760.1 hypothetical protein [Spongospora subterranea]
MSSNLLRPVPNLICVAITILGVCVLVGAEHPEAAKEYFDSNEELSFSTIFTDENPSLWEEWNCIKKQDPSREAEENGATKDTSQDKLTIKQEPDEIKCPASTLQAFPFPKHSDNKKERSCFDEPDPDSPKKKNR